MGARALVEQRGPEGHHVVVVGDAALQQRAVAGIEEQLELEPVPPQRRIALIQGGPVEGGRGFVLHTKDWTSDASLPVAEDLALTASVDILKAIAGGGGPRSGILALGYAGWGPGQLEDEIQANSWLSVDPDEALLFGEGHDEKWRQAMAKLRVDPLLLSGAAGHA